MSLSHLTVESQQAALSKLAGMTARSVTEANVREAGILLTMECGNGRNRDPRTDLCEIQAIYGAVKTGDRRVAALANGVRYVADPILRDFFIAPHRMLQMCERGACGEDCDSQAALVAALLATVGFTAGLRAWGKAGGKYYQHVFAVVLHPKKPEQGKRQRVISLDTTVDRAEVGWAPPKGRVHTAWILRSGESLNPAMIEE